MRNPRRRVALAALAALFPALPVADASAAPRSGSYCVAALSGTPADDAAVRCFATFADMTSHVTGGAFRPDATADPQSLTPRFVRAAAAAGSSVVGIAHDVEVPRWLHFIAPDDTGCTRGRAWDAPSLPAEWDNAIDSIETHSGCVATAWDLQTTEGARIGCSCPAMGAMEDATSSVGFTPQKVAQSSVEALPSEPSVDQVNGSCGWVATRDVTYPVDHRYADDHVWAGFTFSSFVGTADTMYSEVICWLQTTPTAGWSYDEIPSTRHECSTFAAPVGSCGNPVLFQVHPTDEIYACTEVRWYDSNGFHDKHVDYDAAAPGTQCGPVLTRHEM